ncbi:hypothetical protein G3435_26600, partial [Pseudomonas sp. MAFF212428]|nr:hypothetical protein [Pseudomonas brassicae]
MKTRQTRHLLASLATAFTCSFNSTSTCALESPFEQIVSQPKDTFGYQNVESVDPASGSLLIKHIDVNLPGPNGMNITLLRTYNTGALSAGLGSTYRKSFSWTALGPGWTLRAAPRIVHGNLFKSTNRTPSTAPKQIYDKSQMAGALCVGTAVSTLSPAGIFLQLPDGTQHQVFSSGGHKGRTKNNWQVSCINNQVTAHSPDGILYDFGNWSTDRNGGTESTNDIIESSFGMPIDAPVKPTITYIDAKKATDLFGNWIAYDYTPRSTSTTPL